MTSPSRRSGHGPPPDATARPSREEIETLCILHVLGDQPCSVGELACRLGLAADVAHAMAVAVELLIAIGYVEERAGLVSATDAGRAWMERRLSALGCA